MCRGPALLLEGLPPYAVARRLAQRLLAHHAGERRLGGRWSEAVLVNGPVDTLEGLPCDEETRLVIAQLVLARARLRAQPVRLVHRHLTPLLLQPHDVVEHPSVGIQFSLGEVLEVVGIDGWETLLSPFVRHRARKRSRECQALHGWRLLQAKDLCGGELAE